MMKKRKWIIDKMGIKKTNVGYFEKLNQLSLDMPIEAEARSPNPPGLINYRAWALLLNKKIGSFWLDPFGL